MKLGEEIFNIQSSEDFNRAAINVFRYQYQNNETYHNYCKLILKKPIDRIDSVYEIPFLPISFFKTHVIKTTDYNSETTFLSSGTTSNNQSKHYIKQLKIYEKSFNNCFKKFYGNVSNYCILALLPSYLERKGSSLIYMVDSLIQQSKKKESAFYLNNINELTQNIKLLDKTQTPTLLIGVSFALLDLIEHHQFNLKNTIVMETGGMKGIRKELIREDLHERLRNGFGVDKIHSEYGMTELLSQAYAKQTGKYHTPNWMKILIRDVNDPFKYVNKGKTGGINVIDLANLYSCSFIETKDLGKINNDESFNVLGRFDNSDIRGCNLLIN